jgi:hypothetical protein
MNQYDHGVYAPSIRKNNGTYYVYYNAYMTGFYYSTAKNLAGPWSTQPLLDMYGEELLTGPAWDDPVSYTSASINEINWYLLLVPDMVSPKERNNVPDLIILN